jgi:hypothetical protein
MSINLTEVRAAAFRPPAEPDDVRIFRPVTEYLPAPRPATGRSVTAYLAAADRHTDTDAGAWLYREARAAVVGIAAMRAATEDERMALIGEVCAAVAKRGKLAQGDAGRWYLRQTARAIMRDSRTWLDAASLHRTRAARRDGVDAVTVTTHGTATDLAEYTDPMAHRAAVKLADADIALVPASLSPVAALAADALVPAAAKSRAAKHRNVTARLVQSLAGMSGLDVTVALVAHGGESGRSLKAVQAMADRGADLLASTDPLAVLYAVRSAIREHGGGDGGARREPVGIDAIRADCAGAIRDLIRERGGRDVESIRTERALPTWADRKVPADDMPRPATGRSVVAYIAARYDALHRVPAPARDRGITAAPVVTLPAKRERGTADYRPGRSPLLPATAAGAPVGGERMPAPRSWRDGSALRGWAGPGADAAAVALAAKVAARRAKDAAIAAANGK